MINPTTGNPFKERSRMADGGPIESIVSLIRRWAS